MSIRKQDFTGLRFGSWTVENRAPKRGKVIYWSCVCDCGTKREVHHFSLYRGCSKSCGLCHPNPHPSKGKPLTHGLTYSKEYVSWCGAKARCTSPTNRAWPNYGGRGIKMCDRWLNSFENFFADMGPMPSPKHTIERIKNDGNYEPGNCKWATRLEQNQNTRQTRMITVNGVTKCKREWERVLGFHLYHYFRTWPLDEVTKLIADTLASGTRTRTYRRRAASQFDTEIPV